MSDLRERLIEAAGFGIEAEMQDGIIDGSLKKGDTKAGRIFAMLAIQAAWPIIESELQKRDQEIERLKSDLEELRDQGCEYCDASVDDRIVAVEGEPDDFVGQFKNWWQCGQCVNKWSRDIKGIIDESKRLREVNTEANQLLEQTIEVLEAAPEVDNAGRECCEDCDWWLDKAKPLLDNLQALTKEATE